MSSFVQSQVNGLMVAVRTDAVAGGLAHAFTRARHNIDIVVKDPASGHTLVNVEGGTELDHRSGKVVRNPDAKMTPEELKGIPADDATVVAKRLPTVSRDEARKAEADRKAKLAAPVVSKGAPKASTQTEV